MRIYVAGGSSEAAGVALYMRALRTAGAEVTFDWTVPVLAATQPDTQLSEGERLRHAEADIDAIRRCDRLWLLIPKRGSIGAWLELGYALALRRPIITISGDWRSTIFTALANERFDRHDDAYDQIWQDLNPRRVARSP